MCKLTVCQEPIFTLGIMPRCGSNYFHQLLLLHPQCHSATSYEWPEDYLLLKADLLYEYADTISQHWPRQRNLPINTETRHALLKALGDGLISYLNQLADGRPLVTKTPSVVNLSYFFKLFPNARLLILVRDGRSIVESSMRSFGWEFDVAVQRWAKAARTIVEFDQEYKGSQYKYIIVKYEALLDNLEAEMRQIFGFLELDPELYDFDATNRLPVMNSSQFCDGSWQRTLAENSEDFNFKKRWNYWDPFMHQQFNHIAGDYMTKLGYEILQFGA